MSMLKHSALAVVTLILVAFAADARAEHVDWSSYIDHSAPSKAPTAQPDNVVAQNDAPVAKSAKSKKKGAKKAPAKKKKQAARAKKHR
jgi:hypothetical protein